MRSTSSLQLLIIALFLNVIYSCNDQSSNSQDTEDRSFVKDIPKNSNGQEYLVYSYVQKMVDKIHLESLENGYKTTQIRIWYSYFSGDTDQVIILKELNGTWYGERYFYSFNQKKDNHIDTSIFAQKNLTPESGWKSLISNLSDLKIETLPNMEDIPNFNLDINDGDVFSVEFADSNKYRLYTYTSPSSFQDRWWQAKNMQNILILIEKEFGLK